MTCSCQNVPVIRLTMKFYVRSWFRGQVHMEFLLLKGWSIQAAVKDLISDWDSEMFLQLFLQFFFCQAIITPDSCIDWNVIWVTY